MAVCWLSARTCSLPLVIPNPAGGHALIPKNAFGWTTLSGLGHERVESFSSPFSNFYFPISTYKEGRSLPAARFLKARRRPSSSAAVRRPRR